MHLTVGTFNLNNLFSRYNFKAEASSLPDANRIHLDLDKLLVKDTEFVFRSYKGRLVKAKSPKKTQELAGRIKRLDLDILAVQEVEDIDTLKRFNTGYLNRLYSHVGLIEGNDPRLIDVGIMSKYPILGLTSWQHATHPDWPAQPVFGRDLLQVNIMNQAKTQKILTLFINHLKSQFISFDEDPIQAQQQNDKRRFLQAEALITILRNQTRPDSPFIILGDFNDTPESQPLAPLRNNQDNLINALTNATEIINNPDLQLPPDPLWTHRFKPSSEPAHYALLDQIWLSPSLQDNFKNAFIDRRSKLSGDGSDHDPAWIELEL